MSFSLLATLGLDGASFEANLHHAENAAESSGKRIKKSLGGEDEEGEGMFGGVMDKFLEVAAGYEAIHFAQELIEAGKRVRDLSVDLGISTEAVQVYERAFEGLDKVRPALDKLAKAKEEALGDGQDAAKFQNAFAGLGVSGEQLKEMNLEELFEAIGENIRTSTIDTKKLSAELEILGKGGTAMNEGFKRGLGEVKEELESTGAMLGKSALEADKYAKEMETKWWGAIKGIASKSLAGGIMVGAAIFGEGPLSDAMFKQKYDTSSSDDIVRNKSLRIQVDAMQKEFDAQKALDDKKKAADEAEAKGHEAIKARALSIDKERMEIEEKTRWDSLSAEEKKLELVEKRKELEAKVGTSTSPIGNAETLLGIAELNSEIQSIKDDKEPKKETKPEHMDVNAAQRVGAYAYQAAGANLAKESLGVLHGIKAGIDKLNKSQKHGGF